MSAADLVQRLARALAAQGIGPDNRVALVAPPTSATRAVRSAAESLGCTVLCPGTESAERAAEQVIRSEADIVVIFPDTAGAAWLAIRSPQVRRVLGYGPVRGADVDLLRSAREQSERRGGHLGHGDRPTLLP